MVGTAQERLCPPYRFQLQRKLALILSSAAAVLSECRFARSIDVGLCKVLALEQQRLAASPRQRVRKAVAVIQRRGVTSLAIAPPGAPRRIGLFRIDGDDLSADLEQPKIKLTPARIPQPSLEHDRCFEHDRR